jgi:hypothetical protein
LYGGSGLEDRAADRRIGLKIWYPQGCVGSIPTARTSTILGLKQAISKIKSVLKKLGCREVAGLFNAIGTALNSIRSTNALNYIRHEAICYEVV